ncbi:YkgJ family cysteine cluster protein [Shewanella benthica]|uniref:YkgJ family cysteine cluster protein n=1 Tax=Shewanella benthica KT99 TaxID=314608 RepID=A9D4Q0_9GAMM|nr:YkgJ family cysteine cluster protein [Shewanella benthica]EDQ01306.1 hypothetical protein KT99_01676 [Shewanella benthica KT99]
MNCRLGCGACCIAPSITSPIPGMPEGKPAGERCIQLSNDNLCMIFGMKERSEFCSSFSATIDVCGSTNSEAIRLISFLEAQTS